MTYLDKIATSIAASLPDGIVIPSDSKDLFIMYALLMLAKGEHVTEEDVHNAWVAWMEIRGQTHDSMIPFRLLPENVQDEDSPFTVAIRTVARGHNTT